MQKIFVGNLMHVQQQVRLRCEVYHTRLIA